MKRWLSPAIGAVLAAAGIGGTWFGCPFFSPYEGWFLGVGIAVLAYAALRTTYVAADSRWPAEDVEPRPLRLTPLDYVRALICWADGYSRTYAVAPGLYFTGGRYDVQAPLLVTANYRLTIFLLLRRLRGRNVRLLVVDSDGINVWCAAGKGRFGNREIVRQVERYGAETLAGGGKLTLILPKFGMAGVDLRALREAGHRPVVGPLYARDLPAYLDSPPLKDRLDDAVLFGLRARSFTWLPGLLQYVGYALVLSFLLFLVEKATGWPVPGGVLVLTALLGTAYPLLFPWIPGHRFAVKGLWLAAIVSAGLGALAAAGRIDSLDLYPAVPFTFAVALYVALSYTGNSAVSAYTRVRKEIATFLVPGLVLLIIAAGAWVAVEIAR